MCGGPTFRGADTFMPRTHEWANYLLSCRTQYTVVKIQSIKQIIKSNVDGPCAPPERPSHPNDAAHSRAMLPCPVGDRSKLTTVPKRRCEVEAGPIVVRQEALGLACRGTKHILLRCTPSILVFSHSLRARQHEYAGNSFFPL